MKNKIIFSAALTAAFSLMSVTLTGCATQKETAEEPNDSEFHYQHFDLKHHPVSVKDIHCDATMEDGKIVTINEFGYTLYVFNPNGYLSEMQTVNEEDEVTFRDVYTYDDQDKPVNIASKSGSGNPVSNTKCTYEGVRLLKKEVYSQDMDRMQTYDYAYPDLTHTEITYRMDGDLGSITKNTMDGNKVIKRDIFNHTGDCITTEAFTYNEQNKPIQVIRNGKTSLIAYNDRGLVARTERAFYLAYGDLNFYSEEVYTYEYEYDSVGNWIKRMVYVGEGDAKQLEQIDERIITYQAE